MTYSLSNNCTKNYYNRTLTVQVIVEDVVTWIFLKHSVVHAVTYVVKTRKTWKASCIFLFISSACISSFSRFSPSKACLQVLILQSDIGRHVAWNVMTVTMRVRCEWYGFSCWRTSVGLATPVWWRQPTIAPSDIAGLCLLQRQQPQSVTDPCCLHRPSSVGFEIAWSSLETILTEIWQSGWIENVESTKYNDATMNKEQR